MKQLESENKGKVWLAGAGPGDLGLLTVKTFKLLCQADVIVYDALVSAEILSLIPAHTKMINVGKRSGNHPVPQYEINEILAEEAKKGKKVLRLKGGDPFVFGRGGEEIERLLEENIPFEVVPGVTSASAVPAYAGIPVTHRDYTSSFHVITGHARKGKPADIKYKELVKLGGTLVFLMGITSLPSICRGLMDAGMDPDMPAAVLEKGTTAKQRQIISTVAGLPDAALKASVKTPAIILVGKVCSLGEEFHWALDRPLGGRQIVVTRPRRNSSKLAENLRNLGAQVIELPAIETRPVTPDAALEKALERFGTRAEEEWIVFTSPAGVDIFFEQTGNLHADVRTILGNAVRNGAVIRTAAIGSSTARAMKKYGLTADVVPAVYCARELGKAIAQAASKDSAVTVFRAAAASEELLPPLLEAGIQTEDIPIYETVYELHEELHEKLLGMFEAGEIDAVTFTSASTVKGFAAALEGLDFSQVQAVCIGEQTATEAEKYGMQISISEQASMESLTDKILEVLG